MDKLEERNKAILDVLIGRYGKERVLNAVYEIRKENNKK